MKLKGIELEGTYKVVYYNTSFMVSNEKDNEIYFENDNGSWAKSEYDEKGNEIYFENSDGFWIKSEYDEKGNINYCENSDCYWIRREYDEKGNAKYFENNIGEIIDKRVKELTIEEIEKLLGYKIKIREA